MKKINLKTLLIKSIYYRIFIIIIQLFYTYFFINNWEKAFNIAWSWNVINLVLFALYSYIFDSKKSPYVETKGMVIWFTGKPCSGKTTIADVLAKKLKELGKNVERLDGDIVRKGKLSDDLGFNKEDRDRNINRINFISKLLSRNKTIVLASFVSPYRETRNNIRKNVTNFIEVYVKASSEECAKRDVKGMWLRAKKGEIKGFTGYDAPFEKPEKPEIVCNTEKESINDSVNKLLNYLVDKGLI